MVYGIGFLILFGSYVIGAPNYGRPKAKKTKLEATTSKPANIEELDQPFPEEDQQVVEESQVLPTTAVIPAENKPQEVLQPQNLINPNISATTASYDPSESYNPFLDQPMSESEKKLARKELTSPPLDFPYEVTKEEMDLYDKYEKGTATPQEKKQLFGNLMSFRTKPIKQSDMSKTKPASTQSNTNQSTAQKVSSVVSKFFNGFKDKKDAAEDQSSDDKGKEPTNEEIASGLKHGYVDGNEIWFTTAKRADLPEYLNFTHENLKIYQFIAGKDAGMVPSTYTGIKKLYTQVEPAMEQAFHQQYRLPPDWIDRFRFDKDPLEEAKKARYNSNKLLYSLGTNGTVIFEVTKGAIVNKPGVDFMIWSNPFCYLDTPESREEVNASATSTYQSYIPNAGTTASQLDEYAACYADTAKVFVSQKGPEGPWEAIEPCHQGIDPIGSACTGYGMNLWYADPSFNNLTKGGDKYDLEKIPLEVVKAIKIVDMGNGGHALQAGYDLDAIAMINYQE